LSLIAAFNGNAEAGGRPSVLLLLLLHGHSLDVHARRHLSCSEARRSPVYCVREQLHLRSVAADRETALGLEYCMLATPPYLAGATADERLLLA